MKAIITFRILLAVVLLAIFSVLPQALRAQCRTDLLLGQNIVTNGDFSQNYTGWTYTADTDGDLTTGPDGYQVYTASPRSYSIPGNIFVGTGSQMSYFNNAFTSSFNDHSASADDKFLMVDGVCVVGIKLWRQTSIPVVANTRYYFSVWINSLKDNPNYPGILNFDVNGTNLATGIIAPTIGGASPGGAWQKVEAFWDSGASPPATVTISIEGNQTIGCGGPTGESDFAIDDISFVPGCSYGDPGPQPNLGVDQTLCGQGGSITLDSSVPHNATTTVTWSDGTTGTGLLAPYTKIISTPGTYSVCVTDGSSCTKADIIVITNTFTPTTSPNADLCGNPSAPLDAVFTGIGATYQWKLNGSNLPAPSTNRTYTATTAGNYTVDVTVPGCGTVSSGTTVISASATAAPTTSAGADLCKTNPVPLDAVLTGTGITYQWKLNGSNLAAPSTNRTYSAISPGNYTVDVKLPGCTTTTSGTTVVTSSSPVTPVDAFYCANAGLPVSVTLGASGTNSASFNWYTGTSGGSSVNTGATYAISIPAGTTATQTYYVEDPTVKSGTVGPTTEFATGSTADNGAKYNLTQNGILFSPTQDFKLNSLQIPLRIASAAGTTNMTFAITVRVYTALPAPGGTATATTSTISNTVTVPYTATTFAFYTFNFTNFTIPISLGSNLILKIESITSNYAQWQYEMGNRNSITTWAAMPSTITSPNPVSITGSLSGNSVTNTQYFGLYNWNISAVSPCTRIPVRAINNCVTPVTWTSFYLVPQNGSCKLVWSTANETNNSYFSIERSVDGINFETIATTSGAGSKDIASNYYYIDNEPLSGTSYYRVTQHDYDGKFDSTSMKPYLSEGLVNVTTYPNPFQNSTTLLVSGSDATPYTYSVYSVSGQLVEQGSGTMNQTKTIAETEAKGMYMLTVVTSTEILTSKIVKQ